jgi:lamin tail-like protein/beta-propeller repeat-containing protein
MAIKIKAITASVVALLILFEFTIFTATDYLNQHRPASFASSATVTQPPTKLEATTKQQIAETYGKLPLTFEANQGQTDSSVQFISRGSGYNLYLTPAEAVLTLRKENTKAKTGANQLTGYGIARVLDSSGRLGKEPISTDMTTMRMKLVDGNENAEVTGLEPQSARVNYFIGNDPQKWQTDVPIYGRVQYKNIYRGVDLAYYGKQRQLEYDFIVSPGADPKQIRLGFEGVRKIRIDESGDLVLTTKGGDVRQHKPVIYQEIAGSRQEIVGSYVVKANQEVGFEIGTYNTGQPLVIDPVLSYSTYLGGNSDDAGNGIAVDSAGNIYVTGFTYSANFSTLNAYQSGNGGSSDVFVTKLTASGGLSYSTYLGGNADDVGDDIALDSAGNAYVTGVAFSNDFPTLNAYQVNNGGLADAFVTKLTVCGGLGYSTYLGGSGHDVGQGIGVDSAGNAYVTGQTLSNDFPTINALQTSIIGVGLWDAFVTKLNVSGAQQPVVISEFRTHGPSGGNDEFVELYNNTDCAVDMGGWKIKGSNNSASISTLVTIANGTNIPAGGHFLATNIGTNGYSGSVLGDQTYSIGITDNGGIAVTLPDDSVVDQVGLSAGSAFKEGTVLELLAMNNESYERKPGGLSGSTQDTNNNSSDFQVRTPSDPQNLNSTPTPGLAPTPTLIYSTYLGGDSTDYGYDIAVDSAGNAYVTGLTFSHNNFPILNAFQPNNGGGVSAINAFVTKLTASGALSYSTYLGGSHAFANGIAVDNAGNAYVTGVTSSDNFPTLNAFQGSIASPGGGIPDAFVTKLNASGGLSYSTYLGGNRDDWGNGIATDSAGNAYVTGFTRSTNFPTLNAFQPDFRADLSGSDGNDVFVTKLTATGGLGYSTYLGGSRDDLGKGIALDVIGRAYVTGQTSSPDFPTANPLQPFLQGGSDSFVAKIFDSSVFSVEAIVANKGGNSGDVSVSVLGAGFQPGATVKLKAAGQPDIEGVNPIVVSSSRIRTTFNLRVATPGLRDVVVTLQDGSTATLRDGFTIEEGGKAQVWVDIIGRDTIRLGRQQIYNIVYGNRGSIDVEVEHFIILSFPANGNLIVDRAISAYGEPPPQPVVEGLEKAVSIFVPLLPAQSSHSFTVRFSTPNDASVIIGAAIISIPSIETTGNLATHATAQEIEAILTPAVSDETPPVGATVFLGPHGGNPYGHQAIVGVDPTTNQIIIWDHYLGNSPRTLDQWKREVGGPYLGWATPPGWTPAIGQQAAGFAAELISQNGSRIFAGEGGKNWRGDGKYSCAGLGEFVYERAGLNPTAGGLDPFFLLPGVNYRRDTGKTDFYTSATDLTDVARSNVSWLEPLSKSVGGLLNLLRGAQSTMEKALRVVAATDPNEKTGSLGVGGQRYLTGGEPLRYAIYFENVSTATAPAQEVVITDQLDITKLDLNTFNFGPIAFGYKLVTPPSGLSDFNQDVDLRPENDLIVKMNARLDKTTGLLTWRFTSINPATGLPPDDPLAGFLPPNINAPEGEGSVFFTVMPKQSLPTGTEVHNEASIVFDNNPAILTPMWSNTLDNSTPVSNVHALTAIPCSVTLNVQWSGTDTGSGIHGYIIYVSDNGRPFTIWRSNTTATSGTYSGQFGHTYAFYSVAQDQTGNFENAPTSPDATLTLSAPAQPPTILLTGQIITLGPPNHQYETINLSQLVARANDSCGVNLTGNVIIAQVSSDEPEDAQGGGDGDTLNDIVIASNCKSVQLRAERQGSGNGRVYTITFKVSDAAGNISTVTAKVRVPTSQKGNQAVDDGPSYIVIGSCP